MSSPPRPRETFHSLPIVDVRPLLHPRDAGLKATVAALRRAACDVGFLYVVGHGVSRERVTALEGAAREFFGLPEASKLEYHIGRSQHHRGYVPPGEEVFYGQSKDTKEAFDLALELPAADYGRASRLLGPNVWPRELPGFRAAVSAYYAEVFALGRALLGGFALALGLERSFFDAFLTQPPSQLRLIHYTPALAHEGAMGIGSHTDYECLTILHATAAGLEVMNGAGQWVAAPPLRDAFVVNIGDLLEVWSNGVFVSTSHRVRTVSEERYSFPLFFTVDYETRVEPLAQLCSEGARHAPLISGDHLLSQTMQTFRYLIALRQRGLLELPDGARGLASFGRDRAV